MVLGIASEEVQDEMYKAKGILPLVEILSHTQNSALLVESAQLLAILARNRMSKRWQCGAHQVLTDHIYWCACCRMDTPFNRWPIVCYRTIGRDAYSRRGRGVYRCRVAAADKSTFKRYVFVRITVLPLSVSRQDTLTSNINGVQTRTATCSVRQEVFQC
jgi:hypothetical protein